MRTVRAAADVVWLDARKVTRARGAAPKRQYLA
jgi:hypothetical protein